MCVSSTLYAVGSLPNFDWSQVVSWGRVGLALRPILTLSLLSANRVAELAGVIWALNFRLAVLRSVLSATSAIVRRLIFCSPTEPQIHNRSLTIGPPSSAP